MKTDPFINDLAEVLEMEPSDLQESLELTSENWDSLTVLATIALVDEHYDVTVDGGALADCTSIGNLLEKIQQLKSPAN